MSSPTKKTEHIRKRKKTAQGTKRKAKIRSKGSTPPASELFGDNE